jgi:hypothetical protein
MDIIHSYPNPYMRKLGLINTKIYGKKEVVPKVLMDYYLFIETKKCNDINKYFIDYDNAYIDFIYDPSMESMEFNSINDYEKQNGKLTYYEKYQVNILIRQYGEELTRILKIKKKIFTVICPKRIKIIHLNENCKKGKSFTPFKQFWNYSKIMHNIRTNNNDIKIFFFNYIDILFFFYTKTLLYSIKLLQNYPWFIKNKKILYEIDKNDFINTDTITRIRHYDILKSYGSSKNVEKEYISLKKMQDTRKYDYDIVFDCLAIKYKYIIC